MGQLGAVFAARYWELGLDSDLKGKPGAYARCDHYGARAGPEAGASVRRARCAKGKSYRNEVN